MTATYGLMTYRSDGRAVLTPDGAGGVYVEVQNPTMGQSSTKTYTGLRGMSLRIVQIAAGGHSWVTGVDGNGYPFITFTATPPAPSFLTPRSGTTLLIFAV